MEVPLSPSSSFESPVYSSSSVKASAHPIASATTSPTDLEWTLSTATKTPSIDCARLPPAVYTNPSITEFPASRTSLISDYSSPPSDPTFPPHNFPSVTIDHPRRSVAPLSPPLHRVPENPHCSTLSPVNSTLVPTPPNTMSPMSPVDAEDAHTSPSSTVAPSPPRTASIDPQSESLPPASCAHAPTSPSPPATCTSSFTPSHDLLSAPGASLSSQGVALPVTLAPPPATTPATVAVGPDVAHNRTTSTVTPSLDRFNTPPHQNRKRTHPFAASAARAASRRRLCTEDAAQGSVTYLPAYVAGSESSLITDTVLVHDSAPIPAAGVVEAPVRAHIRPFNASQRLTTATDAPASCDSVTVATAPANHTTIATTATDHTPAAARSSGASARAPSTCSVALTVPTSTSFLAPEPPPLSPPQPQSQQHVPNLVHLPRPHAPSQPHVLGHTSGPTPHARTPADMHVDDAYHERHTSSNHVWQKPQRAAYATTPVPSALASDEARSKLMRPGFVASPPTHARTLPTGFMNTSGATPRVDSSAHCLEEEEYVLLVVTSFTHHSSDFLLAKTSSMTEEVWGAIAALHGPYYNTESRLVLLQGIIKNAQFKKKDNVCAASAIPTEFYEQYLALACQRDKALQAPHAPHAPHSTPTASPHRLRRPASAEVVGGSAGAGILPSASFVGTAKCMGTYTSTHAASHSASHSTSATLAQGPRTIPAQVARPVHPVSMASTLTPHSARSLPFATPPAMDGASPSRRTRHIRVSSPLRSAVRTASPPAYARSIDTTSGAPIAAETLTAPAAETDGRGNDSVITNGSAEAEVPARGAAAKVSASSTTLDDTSSNISCTSDKNESSLSSQPTFSIPAPLLPPHSATTQSAGTASEPSSKLGSPDKLHVPVKRMVRPTSGSGDTSLPFATGAHTQRMHVSGTHAYPHSPPPKNTALAHLSRSHTPRGVSQGCWYNPAVINKRISSVYTIFFP